LFAHRDAAKTAKETKNPSHVATAITDSYTSGHPGIVCRGRISRKSGGRKNEATAIAKQVKIIAEIKRTVRLASEEKGRGDGSRDDEGDVLPAIRLIYF
jgi:hypothetical protein